MDVMNARELAVAAVERLMEDGHEIAIGTTVVGLDANGYWVTDNGEEVDTLTKAQAIKIVAENLAANGFVTVAFGSNEYTLVTQPDFSNRVFVGWWGDAVVGEPYTAEFCADAVDNAGNRYVVYWQFDAVKGLEPPIDGYPWGDESIVRVMAQ